MIWTLSLLFATSILSIRFILWPIVYYFHDPKRLRKYPNLHFLSGISDLPFIWHAHKGFRSQKLLELHRRHPIIRIGPNSLSYGDAGAIKDIYGHNTQCNKDVFYSTLSGSHFHLADVIDRHEHARKRKTMASAYAIKNLEGWEFKVADMVSRIIKAFDTHCIVPPTKDKVFAQEENDRTLDFRMWSNLFTISAIANIGLSEDLGFLEQGNDSVISESKDTGELKRVRFRECLFATAWAQSNLVWAYEWYHTLVLISKWVSSRYRKCWALNKDWDGIVYNRATTRLRRYREGEKLDDFFHAMMEDKNGKPHNLEWGEIIAEISIMMNAGSDTTAIAINNALYLLLKNPECLAKLRAELDDALEEKDVVAPYDKVKYLPYLKACLDESMRILPPVSFGLPRRTPKEGTSILGDFIAGDTTVSMSAYVVHHDESIFVDPESYIPERWLGEEGKQLQSFFIAFSAGARGCIGRNISYLEQTVLIASLIRRYDFALPHPDWEPTRRENTTLGSGPMPLKIWRRTA